MNLKPSQCDIKKLSITDHSKSIVIDSNYPELKLIEYVDTIDIYENVFSPCITADIGINDGGSFREKFNISGDEVFNIEFVGYGNEDPLKYTLNVVEVMSILPNTNLRSKVVGLRLASKELLTDSVSAISKSYSVGTKQIFQDIINNFLGSKKKLSIEDTKDLPVVVIPYMSPFKAIDFLRQKLVSPKYKSSSFLFFENAEGYVLTTVEGLFDRASKSKQQRFFQNEAISEGVKGSASEITDLDSFHMFSSYTVKSPVNLNNIFVNGAVKSTITQYDVTTKQYDRRLFENNTQIFFDPTNNKNPQITTEIFKQYSSGGNKPYFLPYAKYKNTSNPTINFEYDTLAERLCYSTLFTSQKTFIDIPGNTKIGAGSLIELVVPRYDAKEKKGINDVESGLYLVTACKHSIKIADTSKFDSHLELMRFGRGVYQK